MTNLEKYQVGNLAKCNIDIQNSDAREIVKILQINENNKWIIQSQGIENNIGKEKDELYPISLNFENLEMLGFKSNSDKTEWTNNNLSLQSQAVYAENINKKTSFLIKNNGAYKLISIEGKSLADSIQTLHALQNAYTKFFPNAQLDTSLFFVM